MHHVHNDEQTVIETNKKKKKKQNHRETETETDYRKSNTERHCVEPQI